MSENIDANKLGGKMYYSKDLMLIQILSEISEVLTHIGHPFPFSLDTRKKITAIVGKIEELKDMMEVK